ncbi:MAG: 3-deoxy-7-phosphoheptulonate synthase [Planctomycetota bacterium]
MLRLESGAKRRADAPTMLLRLRKNPVPADLGAVMEVASRLGYSARRLGGREDLLALEKVPGAPPAGPEELAAFGDLTAVAAILDRGDIVELWRSTPDRPRTVVEAGRARFGDGSVSIIAGPCAVEDAARLLEVARAVAARGATLLRGGAYKPRTSPYSFQGLGPAGLELLAATREETGLGIVTEVLDPRDVGTVADVADVVQIGARSMANYALLKEVSQIDRPVLLKRGFGATVDEFLGAAEYVLVGGNERVILCERGVRGFDSVTRNLLDVGAIAHLASATHLPVIADPSHAAGRADLVRAVGRAGLVAGADGLLIEVHPAPAEVHSDGRQAIGLDEFERLVADADALCALDGRTLLGPSRAVPGIEGRGPATLRGTA